MKLIHGDCLEEMKKMESESIDLIVTSPPYDNLRTYNGTLNWSFDIFKNIAKECARIIKKGGVIVWVVGDATIKGSETGTSFRQALYFKEIGLNIHDTMIYNKGNTPFPDKNRYYQCFEYMFILSKGKPKSINLIEDKKNKTGNSNIKSTTLRQKDGSLKITSGEKLYGNKKIKEFGVRFNIWDISPGYGKSHTDKLGYEHPATFPEKLAEDHILSWSNEGDIVLDPFMGSNTTGKMCKLNNRDFIGIELDETYFNIAKDRILN